MNIQRKKEGFLNLFDAVVYLERCSFFEKFTCLFLCSTIFPFYGWMRSLSLVEQVHLEFAWFWGRPPSFWGGEVINWGFWIGVRWEQVLFPHPLYFYEVVWDVMMIFNYFFVMSWFWHRFSFLGGNSGSTKFGITASHRIIWEDLLKNKHFSLPSFVLIATSREKNAHFSFGNFLPTSWKHGRNSKHV